MRRLGLRLSVCAALALGLAAWLGGCVSRVTPPAAPPDPVVVYVVTEGRHTGLALPGREGWWVYGYGDWDWYARNRTAWYHVYGTVLWPTPGALGRRRAAAPRPGPGAAPLRVARARVEALAAELARPFREQAAAAVWNPRHGMTFVPAAEGFWFLYNCHDAVAAWLRRLGCRVRWVPVRLGLAVAPPAESRSGEKRPATPAR